VHFFVSCENSIYQYSRHPPIFQPSLLWNLIAVDSIVSWQPVGYDSHCNAEGRTPLTAVATTRPSLIGNFCRAEFEIIFAAQTSSRNFEFEKTPKPESFCHRVDYTTISKAIPVASYLLTIVIKQSIHHLSSACSHRKFSAIAAAHVNS
jgi:hypothetical protein